MRLANVKTRTETGFEHVLQSINVLTPFGLKELKGITPFYPGDEARLKREFSKLEAVLRVVKEQPRKISALSEIFMETKEISLTVERSVKSALSVIELYEIKSFLLQTKKMTDLLSDISHGIPKEFIPYDTTALLDVLDPGKDRIDTFYIYDSFSEKLATLRKEKRELELAVRREQKEIKRRLEVENGFSMTPKCELLVSKSDEPTLKKARELPELVQSEEDYMSVTFVIKSNDTMYALQKGMEEKNNGIEEEEVAVRELLSRRIAQEADNLRTNCERIGKLDFNVAKARYADDHDCVKPEITDEHIVEIEDGRHLVVEEILNKKGKEYCPVSIKLRDGVTCITGANMGGKTISLKLVGLTAVLAQYGFFVPCKAAKLGLSSYIHMLIGDSQNLQRGLSSFGSEMEELKDILDNSKEGSLLLIDEIASGTNPVEGLALTKSLISYLVVRGYISVITTHFDHAAVGNTVQNMQVRGLADADFGKLVKELSYANRRERIEIIGKYMDYRLYVVQNEEEIPKDALNIAKMLGIYDEIIDRARAMIAEDSQK